jgi:hypothetical protein
MLTYQQLDVIADSYIPILFIVSVFFLATEIFKFGFKRKFVELGSVIASILIVYSVMLLDGYFKIWPLLDLDYSTHTALSLVFVVYLSSKSKTILVMSVLSFLLYVLLMIYQKYHTVADIISTSIVLIPIFFALIHRKILRNSIVGR